VKDRKEKEIMAKDEPKRCAHEPCRCLVPHGQEYCDESCRDAGREEVEIACGCGHPRCPLT
jgi:hypothetical protein